MCLDHLRRNDVHSTIWSLNTRVHYAILFFSFATISVAASPLKIAASPGKPKKQNPLATKVPGLKIFLKPTLNSFLSLPGYFLFLFFPGRTGEGGSTSTSDSTRDDAFRSLFSNRLDDFMDSTSSTGDIFPPPLASSRSGQLTTHLFNRMHGAMLWETLWEFHHLENNVGEN